MPKAVQKNCGIFLSIMLSVFFPAQVVFAGNPVAPIEPADNIQDPGALSTPWGGCGPTDSNCYVTVTGGGYTDEQAQDAVGNIFSAEFTYSDATPSVSINSINVSKLAGTLSVTSGGTGLGSLGSANQLIKVNAGATALEYFTPTYLTANQTITLSGDATGSGATSIVMTIASDSVALGTDTTGNYVSGATASGGLSLTGTEGATLGILLTSVTDGLSSATSSGSGLELLSSGITLLQGCADNQILKWNEGTDSWGCSTDASGGGAGNSFETISTPSGTNPVADASTDTLTLTATGSNFAITGNSGSDTIDFDVIESVLAGSGLVVNSSALDISTGNGIQITSDAVALGALSAAWNQTGAFDISLNHASSELQILESAGGTFFGIFDVGDLGADRTYTFPDVSGTVCISGSTCVASAVAWNAITNPTVTQSLTFDDGELNAWTVSSDTETFQTITANSLTTGKITALSATGLTTGIAETITLGSALTTGGALSISGASYAHTSTETASLVSIAFTDASSAGAITPTDNAILISPTFNNTNSSTRTINGVSIQPTYTQCGIGGTCLINGLNLVAVTDISRVTSTAVMVGSGWDNVIDSVGFDVVNTTGATTITGSADGTDALTLTAGDILLSNGDLDLSGGDFNVVLDASDEVDITKTATAASTEEGIDITFTTGAGDGSDVYSGIRIAGTSANHSASSDKFYGINIANLTSADAEGDETALFVGTGWDNIFSNGTYSLTNAGVLTVASCSGCGGGGTTWNTIGAPTGDLALTFDAGEETVFTMSATTATAFQMASSTLSSGTLLDLTVTGTAGVSSQKALNISTSGAVTGTQTTYGAYFSNSHSGANATNIGLYAEAYNSSLDNIAGKFVNNAAGFQPAVVIRNNDTSTTGYTQLAFENNSASQVWGVGVGNSTETANGLANDFFIYNLNDTAVRLVINDAGNVGIGTTNPGAQLHVSATGASTIQIGDGATVNDYAQLGFSGNSLTNNNSIAYIPFVNFAAGTYNPSAYIDVVKDGTGTDDRADIAFGTDGGSGLAERLRIDATGVVGIGDVSPDYLLDVANTSTDGNIFSITDSDGECLYNPESGSVTVTCSSDERLKTNIVDAQSALDYFRPFKVREYNVIASGDKMVGVIAQEVLLTNPELVTTGSSGMYSVQLPSQWQLVKAVQELDIKIKDIQDLVEGDNSFVGKLRSWLANSNNGITTIFANLFEGNTIKGREKVCVGNTCIDEDQLKALIQNAGGQVDTPTPPEPESSPEIIPETPPEEVPPSDEVINPEPTTP